MEVNPPRGHADVDVDSRGLERPGPIELGDWRTIGCVKGDVTKINHLWTRTGQSEVNEIEITRRIPWRWPSVEPSAPMMAKNSSRASLRASECCYAEAESKWIDVS